MNALPSRVKLVEVGPRDGLQNEKQTIGADIKVALVERLADAGLPNVEAAIKRAEVVWRTSHAPKVEAS